MQRFWERILKFLRDPAIQTLLAFLALLGAVGTIVWGFIKGWLSRVFTWLMQFTPLPNWLGPLLVITLLSLGGFWIRKNLHRRKMKQETKHDEIIYHEVWGVLWGWPPIRGHYIGGGPLCPIHMLPVDHKTIRVGRGNDYIEFHCPGDQGKEAHEIKGPKLTDLVGSQQDGWNQNPNIYKDVNARLSAKFRK